MATISKLEDGMRILESELHEVLSSWIVYKEAIPKRWKRDVKPINPMSYNDLQLSGLAGCSRLVSRARKTMQWLTSLSDTLRELSTAIQEEAEASQENFKVVSNMCNLIILPNELLVRIFQLAVNGNPGLTLSIRSKTAVAISHVSQYFRNTALHCRSLWTNISGKPGMDLLCLSRSKDMLLEVATIVKLKPGRNRKEMIFEQSLIDSLPHSKRWKGLDVRYVSVSGPNLIPNGSSEFRQAFQEIDARSLESLRIRNTSDFFNLFEDYGEFRLWNTPNLRHLESFQYFPLSLPGLANLTDLDVTLKPGQINLADFHRDLARMKNLEYFSLKMQEAQYGNGQLRLFDTLEFPMVRQVKMKMEGQRNDWISFFKPFFSSMIFPNAVDLHVKLSGYVEKMYFEADEASLALSAEMETIVRHNMQFPLVEHFCLEANGKNIDVATTNFPKETQESKISVSIPLGLLPNIKHLTLRSNACLSPHHFALPSGNLLGIPALETVTVQITKSAANYVANFVQDLLTKQKERGEWGELRELIVEDISLGDKGKTASKTHAGEDALDWCKRRGDWRTANETIID